MSTSLSSAVLDHPVIAERLFFPRRHPIERPFTVPCDGAELACYLRDDRPGAPLLVHFHGNGEVVADYLPGYADDISALGVNVLLAEYRGYGGSTGAVQLGRMLGDVAALVSALDRPTAQLIVYGRSIGSIFAIELAHRFPDIAALVIESGIADVLERLLIRVTPRELGVSAEELAAIVGEHLDHRRKLAGYRGPLLVLHARDDDLLEPSHAERNHEWAASRDKELVLFDRGGHNAILLANWSEYLATLQRFIARVTGDSA